MPLLKPNRLSGTNPGWHLSNVLASIDIFGKPVPSFNLKGQEKVTTALGGLLSFAIVVILVLYATTKALVMIHRTNPIVNAIDLPD